MPVWVGQACNRKSAGMAAMRIELFNNLLITCAQQPVLSVNTNRLQSLLAWLVLHSESAQPREQLAFLLWPESSESQARTNLRQLLHHLRRALPAECCLPGGGQPQRAVAPRPGLHHRRGGIRCRAGARGGRRQTRRRGWGARGARRSRAPLPGRSAARPLRRLAPAQAGTLPPPTGARAAPPGDAARSAAATIPRPSVTPNAWWRWIRWPRRTTRC